MDLELVPIKVSLTCLVTLEVDLLYISFKKILFSSTLWKYVAPTIRTNIFYVSTKEKDETPPQFSPVLNKKGVST